MKSPHALSIIACCLVSSSLFAASVSVINDTPLTTTISSSNGISQEVGANNSFTLKRSNDRDQTVMQQNNQWRISTAESSMKCSFSLPKSYQPNAPCKIQIYRGFLVISTASADTIQKCTASAD